MVAAQTVTDLDGLEMREIIYQKHHRVEGAAWITINRPDRRNATTRRTWREIEAAIEDADKDVTIGVVVLTGQGDKAFCAGGDIGEHPDEEAQPSKNVRIRAHGGIEDILKPVIARVCGFAVGGGNHLAYHCDLTIACEEHAQFGQNGARVASPASGHMVQDLAAIVGMKKAKELWYLCRRYSAKQAVDMGLANVAVPHDKLDEEVDQWCREIVVKSPTCLAVFKYTFRDTYLWLRDHTDMGAVVGDVNPAFYGEGGEAVEGKYAFLERREPDFVRFRKNIIGKGLRDEDIIQDS